MRGFILNQYQNNKEIRGKRAGGYSVKCLRYIEQLKLAAGIKNKTQALHHMLPTIVDTVTGKYQDITELKVGIIKPMDHISDDQQMKQDTGG